MSFEAADKPGYYLRNHNSLLKLEAQETGSNKDVFDKDATFFAVKDKYFDGFYALESSNHPGQFIRHENAVLKINKEDNSELFKNDASFQVMTRMPTVKKGTSYCLLCISN